jgi:hypothetical protein
MNAAAGLGTLFKHCQSVLTSGEPEREIHRASKIIRNQKTKLIFGEHLSSSYRLSSLDDSNQHIKDASASAKCSPVEHFRTGPATGRLS